MTCIYLVVFTIIIPLYQNRYELRYDFNLKGRLVKYQLLVLNSVTLSPNTSIIWFIIKAKE